MTISATTIEVSTVADGSTSKFPVGFSYLNANEVQVYLDKVLQTSGYNIIDVLGIKNISFIANPASGVKVKRRRKTAITQSTTYETSGNFPAKAHEAALDKLTMVAQELSLGVDDATWPVEPNSMLGRDASGNKITIAQQPALTFADGLRGKIKLSSGGTDWALDDGSYGGVVVSASGRSMLANGGVWELRDKAALNASALPAIITQVWLTKSKTRWFRLGAVPGVLSYKQTTSHGGTVAWEADIDVIDFEALGVKGDDSDEGSFIADIMNSIPTMQVAQYYKPTVILLEGGKRYYAPNGQFQIFQNHSMIGTKGGMAMVRGGAFPALTISHNNSVNIPLDCSVQNLWLCNDPTSGSGNPALLALSTAYLRVKDCIVAPPDLNPASGASAKACSGPGMEVKFSTSAQFHNNKILRPGTHGIYCHAGAKTYVGPSTVYGGSTALEVIGNRIAHLPAGVGVFARQTNNVFSQMNKIEDCSSGGMIIDACQDFAISKDYFEVCGTDITVRTTANEFPGLVVDTPVLSGLIEGVYSTSTNGILVGTSGNVDGVIVRDNQISGFSQFYGTANKCVWGRQRRMVGTFSNLGTNTIREDDLYATATLDIASLAAGATRAEATVTCPGAAVGDFVEVIASGDLLGVQMTARVSAANTIEPRSSNPTSGAADPASMNFKYRVRKA